MNFTQFLQMLYARKWIILAILLSVVAVTALVSLLLPKQYQATATLLVDSKSKDALSGQILPSQMFPGYMATQIEIIKSKNVGTRVVRQLGLDRNPAVISDFREATGGKGDIVDWMAGRILPQLDVEPSRDSNLIDIKYSGSDPQFTTILANAFAKAYLEANLEMKVMPAKENMSWLDEQIRTMREKVDEAQQRLTTYQTENNLVEFEERLDVESRRMSDIAAQIVAAQSISFDASSRARGGDALPDVQNNPVVQGLRVQLSQGETRLAELANRLGINHPDYQRALSEVESLRSKLISETRAASRGVGASATAAQRRVADMEAAFAVQKNKVLELKEKREQANLLARELDNAQRIYDTALQRQSVTTMESQSTQTDITILNPATIPLRPSKPNVWLNVLVATFLGTLLGIGIGLGTELTNRRLRTHYDFGDVLGIPLLAYAKSNTGARLLHKFRRS